MGSRESASERLVTDVIRAHVRPRYLKRVDENTGISVHDLEVGHQDGTVSAVEVTEDRDPAEAQWRAQPSAEVAVPGCAQGWSITLSAAPDRPRQWARRHLAPFLAALEAAGATESTIYPDSPHSTSTPAELADLGYVAAVSAPAVTPGHAALRIEAWSRASSGDFLATWVEEFASSGRCAGERAKLRASGLASRHLAVVIPFVPASGWDIRSSLAAVPDVGPPTRLPLLPAEITHFWLISDYPGVPSLLAGQAEWEVVPPARPA